jgi:hypothetical protein
MRGPSISPLLIALRIATSVKARHDPTSRTVVNPARKVRLAFAAPARASSASDEISGSATPDP